MVDLTEHATFQELCRAVQSASVGMLRHQGFDLGAHARRVAPGLAGGLLAPDNTFTYYKEPLRFRLAGCTVESVPLPRRLVKYPLSMNVEDSGTAFVLNAECSDEQWRTDPIGVMRNVLTLVAQDPERRIEDIPALTADAERELRALVNPDTDRPPSRCRRRWPPGSNAPRGPNPTASRCPTVPGGSPTPSWTPGPGRSRGA